MATASMNGRAGLDPELPIDEAVRGGLFFKKDRPPRVAGHADEIGIGGQEPQIAIVDLGEGSVDEIEGDRLPDGAQSRALVVGLVIGDRRHLFIGEVDPRFRRQECVPFSVSEARGR